MNLDDAQAAQYAEQGYVFLPGLFSDAEIKVLMDEVPGIYAQRRDEVVREKDGETVRTAFAVQNYSEPFRRLSRHPRLIEPAMQMVGGAVSPSFFRYLRTSMLKMSWSTAFSPIPSPWWSGKRLDSITVF